MSKIFSVFKTTGGRCWSEYLTLHVIADDVEEAKKMAHDFLYDNKDYPNFRGIEIRDGDIEELGSAGKGVIVADYDYIDK